MSDLIQGFFYGTESNQTIPDSRCYTTYPKMTLSFSNSLEQSLSGNFTPAHIFQNLQNYTLAINFLATWTSYCEFGLLFTRLDNTVESLSGLTNAFYKGVLNYSSLEVIFNDFKVAYQSGDCYTMARDFGKAFSIIFDFTVAEEFI